MQSSGKNCWISDFSHIYVEEDIAEHENTRKILAKFPRARVLLIQNYMDVFCRPEQDFRAQKHSVKLILARCHGRLAYPGAAVCPDFGSAHFYYASSALGCVYDCDYCYLHGMYSSANLVVFVNLEDTFAEIDRLLTQFPVYLCVSYDTDLLALDGVTGFASAWLAFARERPRLTVELRTKSANAAALLKQEPADNIIPAWTLSPAYFAEKYEHGAPGLDLRLAALKSAAEAGWKVRLCFDPMLDVKGWREAYAALIERVFAEIPAKAVRDVSVGVFRVGRDYLKSMEKRRPDSELTQYPYQCENGVCSYPEALRNKMLSFAAAQAARYLDEKRIFVGN